VCFYFRENEEVAKTETKNSISPKEKQFDLRAPQCHVFSILSSSRSGSWWERRTRLERRLSLCATVVVFVAVGLAIAMAALIYRGQQNDPSKGSAIFPILNFFGFLNYYYFFSVLLGNDAID
jgi:hypothetical protein